MENTINLEEFTGRDKVHILSGRERGQEARTKFKLDALDAANVIVEVIIPAYIYSVTPSFIAGLFGKSVRAHGNDTERFREHFRFVAPPIVLEQLDRGLSEVATIGDSNNMP